MRRLDRLARRARREADLAMAAADDVARGRDHAGALAVCGPLAEAGVTRVHNDVAARFGEGRGVARDPAEAAPAWQCRAALGHADGPRLWATARGGHNPPGVAQAERRPAAPSFGALAEAGA